MDLGFFDGMVTGLARCDAAIAAGKNSMVFDWHKAAQLIKDKKPKRVGAGLRSDWAYTGGMIHMDGKVVPQDDTYTYLQSLWAVPEIELDGVKMECYIEKTDDVAWDAHTYWPDSARTILNS